MITSRHLSNPKTENWYRLKMVDPDNEYGYSKVEALIALQISAGYYTIYPNMARNFVNIFSSTSQSKKVTIQLSDNMGRVLATQLSMISNASPAVIPVAKYKTGCTIWSLQTNSSHLNIK